MSDDGVAWAADAVGSGVVGTRALPGGQTSTLLVLTHTDGRESVLRVIDREPWASRRAELAAREHRTQVDLAGTPVPAPHSLAVDAGAGVHLMSLLPGTGDAARADDASLRALAVTLAEIHEVRPAVPPRDYQSWAWEAKYEVPHWAHRLDAWAAAFDLLRAEPPDYEPTFLHRDFGPHNVLWEGERVSGVVDWVETSTGPAWLDVAHAATNIAVRAGEEQAAAFMAAYTACTGRQGAALWEVMDVVGFLPPPGRAMFFDDPRQRSALEERLVAALART